MSKDKPDAGEKTLHYDHLRVLGIKRMVPYVPPKREKAAPSSAGKQGRPRKKVPVSDDQGEAG